MATKKRYDEKCPHCLSELGSIYNFYVNYDYPDPDGSFAFACPHCEKPIEVFMQREIVFSLAKYACQKCGKVELKDIDDQYCQPCKNAILKSRLMAEHGRIPI